MEVIGEAENWLTNMALAAEKLGIEIMYVFCLFLN